MNFTKSNNEFSKLWGLYKPSNGAAITNVKATVDYITDNEALNKTEYEVDITLDKADTFLGGIIDISTDAFDENIYHGRFWAKNQKYQYKNGKFIISGTANNSLKQYNTYKVILSDIQ